MLDRKRAARCGAQLLCGLALWMGGAVATAATIENFYGEYYGEVSSDAKNEVTVRDMHVVVQPAERGFNMSWTSVIRKVGGRVKRFKYKIDFVPTQRENIYSSAMRKNKFGQAVPLDPMSGKPYFWARVLGDTITVHSIRVTDEGGYELETYVRTLVGQGMELSYRREQDGEVLRLVTGKLRRAD